MHGTPLPRTGLAAEASSVGQTPPPHFAGLGPHVRVSQALLVTRSAKGKVRTTIPEDLREAAESRRGRSERFRRGRPSVWSLPPRSHLEVCCCHAYVREGLTSAATESPALVRGGGGVLFGPRRIHLPPGGPES